ncbi:hypothetical protein NDU88_002430 [Pleurodeles waltl]|uniref:Uncharacterized protein n=1 Tax=Pleurodeles waltl TaxID=8319 RepID=A0AAV7MNU0_PLEWA|nr:hypothetical protein NDU88_002430 [Pleurodeles waltl]
MVSRPDVSSVRDVGPLTAGRCYINHSPCHGLGRKAGRAPLAGAASSRAPAPRRGQKCGAALGPTSWSDITAARPPGRPRVRWLKWAVARQLASLPALDENANPAARQPACSVRSGCGGRSTNAGTSEGRAASGFTKAEVVYVTQPPGWSLTRLPMRVRSWRLVFPRDHRPRS